MRDGPDQPAERFSESVAGGNRLSRILDGAVRSKAKRLAAAIVILRQTVGFAVDLG
jgi:hypothetical protein